MTKNPSVTKLDSETQAALAEQYRAGLSYCFLNVGSFDPDAAVACLLKCAESGHMPDAYFALGLLCEQNHLGARLHGGLAAGQKSVDEIASELCLSPAEARALTVSAAREQARKLYGTGSASGSAKCAYAQGAMLPASDRAAAVLFTQTRDAISAEAAAGDAISAHIYSKYFERGIGGCEKNRHARVYWLIEGAELGYAPAQAELARCYQSGDGITENKVLAYEYFHKAAAAGNIDARTGKAICLLHGEGVAKDAVLAVELLEGLEKSGLASGEVLFALGSCHERGIGRLHVNRTKAAIYYRRAAETGNADAQLVLGKHIQHNIKSDAERQRAYELFVSAAHGGSTEAKYEAGRCLLLGLGVTKNHVDALKYLTEAAEKGLAEAQYLLGIAYQTADLKRRDYAKSYAGFFAAEAQGHAGARAEAAACRARGQGVAPDAADEQTL